MLLLLLACDAPAPDTARDDTAAPLGDPATVALAGPCALATRFGGFSVESTEGYAVVDGRIADGVVPITVLEEVRVEGDCRMLRRNNPWCDPACDAASACDFDGACIAYPEEQDLGTVDVMGLVQAVSMQPRTPGAHYFDTTLPNPPYTADAFVELRAGDLVLHGVGVEPLTLLSAEWTLRPASPLEITWEPPRGLARSEVLLRLSIDQHGATPASVECRFADDGAGTVPAALVDSLRASGISGFPNGLLSRRTVDSAAFGEGCADFVVGAPRLPSVSVEGSTPCDDVSDCPDGQSCDLALEICE